MGGAHLSDRGRVHQAAVLGEPIVAGDRRQAIAFRQLRDTVAAPFINTPMRRIRSCCAWTASGQRRSAAEKRDELAPLHAAERVCGGRRLRKPAMGP